MPLLSNNSSPTSKKGSDQHRPAALYCTKDRVHVGELYRYVITYTPASSGSSSPTSHAPSLWLKIKNLESVALRAAYLAGPYMLYVDVRSEDYNQNEKVYSTAEQPFYDPQLKPGQSTYVELFLNKQKWKYVWIIDVVSQIIFSTNSEVQFELAVGPTRRSVSSAKYEDFHSHHGITATTPRSPLVSGLSVRRIDTLDIWHSPIPRVDKPLHLVIITHGLHSNVGADMLYVKEQIDAMAKTTGENIIVRGYFGNVCKTEKGIKFQGRRLGDYVLDVLASGSEDQVKPSKISFIAHSLGGLVQTFAVAHIQAKDPTFFKRIKPQNFICLATPFLGISHENPGYVKFALDIGLVGKTGRDLGLAWNVNKKLKHHKPLLQILPGGPAHEALVKFKSRTLYANAINDGIVPLRTASILYLDWKGISRAGIQLDHKGQGKNGRPGNGKTTDLSDDAEDSGSATEVPAKSELPKSAVKSDKNGSVLPAFFSFIAPQAGTKKKTRIIKRTQTVGSSVSSSDEEDAESILRGIPKPSSVIESGISVLVPPLPSPSFINDPSSRPNIILHDKVYHEEDLPPRRFKARSSLFNLNSRNNSSASSSSISKSSSGSESSEIGSVSNPLEKHSSNSKVEQSKLEERIAREWHRGMSWRKILVKLEPDAHNNIIVRRRFANAYGWPVIDHLVKNHFLDTVSKIEPQEEHVSHVDSFDGTDLATMAYRLDDDDDKADCNNKNGNDDDTGNPIKKAQSNVSTMSSASVGSGYSVKRAWDSHLAVASDDSDDEGIVFNLNNWIDNFRDIQQPDQQLLKHEQEQTSSNTIPEPIEGID